MKGADEIPVKIELAIQLFKDYLSLPAFPFQQT